MTMTATTGGLSVLDDVLAEGTSGQYIEVDLTDGAGVAVNTGAIISITGTLRSLGETDATIFTAANLLSTGRATYPGTAGRVRVTFLAADMAAIGTREYQRRELTLTLLHSTDRVFVCGVRFGLHNLRDSG